MSKPFFVEGLHKPNINPKITEMWHSIHNPSLTQGWVDESEFDAEYKKSFTKRFWWHSFPWGREKESKGMFLFKDGTRIAGMILKRKKTLNELLKR